MAYSGKPWRVRVEGPESSARDFDNGGEASGYADQQRREGHRVVVLGLSRRTGCYEPKAILNPEPS